MQHTLMELQSSNENSFIDIWDIINVLSMGMDYGYQIKTRMSNTNMNIFILDRQIFSTDTMLF